MEILKTISSRAEAKSLRFLLIGGHAVNVYGLSRQTGDIDLLVSKTDRSGWNELVQSLGYTSFQMTEQFARFKPGEIAAWPIDLMFVDDMTFEKMYGDSQEISDPLVSFRVVSVRHLIRLKIHALKSDLPHRFPKDYNDLIGLLRTQKHGFTSEDLREICERYASIELFEKIAKDVVL